VLSAALPAPGAGFGLLEQCAVLVELGRAVAPVPYLASIVMAASAIAKFGTRAARTRWVRPAANGQLVLNAALSEKPGRSRRPRHPPAAGGRCTA
jgi:acyl-CoA dehydrogenase